MPPTTLSLWVTVFWAIILASLATHAQEQQCNDWTDKKCCDAMCMTWCPSTKRCDEIACLDDVSTRYCDGYSTTDYLIIGGVALGLVLLVCCFCISGYACSRRRRINTDLSVEVQGQSFAINSTTDRSLTYGAYTPNEYPFV